jgi:predicted transcriptional regulator
MKSKAIKIGICSGRQQLAEFKEAWKRAERGLPPVEPVDRLYFPDTTTMFRVLSRTRLQLLSVLRQRGTTSVLALAKALDRDYKNVYEDVKALKRFGLIRQAKGGVSVPFDRILMDAEIRLAA